MRIQDIDPRDKAVYKPDPTFNPQRNAQVIQEVHDDTRKFFKRLEDTYEREMENRVDILSSFARYKFDRLGDQKLKGYVGKRLHTQLVGEKLLEKVRIMQSVDKLALRRKIQI